MAKSKRTSVKSSVPAPRAEVNIDLSKGEYRWIKPLDDRWVYAALLIICFLLFGNTLNHQYALDDGVVIHHNEYVSKGIQGIPMLFKLDQMQPFLKQMNSGDAIGGGRYRPLPGVTFAIEQSLIGPIDQGGIYNPNCWDINNNGRADANEDLNNDGMANINDCYKGAFLRHFNNILLYFGCLCSIFLLLSQFFFNKEKEVALGITLLFCFHPLHSEIVSNIKSRDESMALMFMCLTMYHVFRYYYTMRWWDPLFAGIWFLLAFFSKEYAISLFVLIPMALYLFVQSPQFKKLTVPGLVLSVCTGIYFMLKAMVNLSKNNVKGAVDSFPGISFLDATATKIYVLWLYFEKCVFASELSADYSFNAIAFTSFSNPKVWASFLLYIALVGFMLYFLKKKNGLAFGIAFFGIHIAMVANFFFDITFVMADRVAFHSSLGMCFLLGLGIYFLIKRIDQSQNFKAVSYFSIIGILCLMYGYRTFERNSDWKDGNTIFKKDVMTVPNSVMALNNAGKAYLEESEGIDVSESIKKEKLLKGRDLLKHSIAVSEGNVLASINLGAIEYKLGNLAAADSIWQYVLKVYPNHPSVPGIKSAMVGKYIKEALDCGKKGDYENAIKILNQGLERFPTNADLYYNLGGALFSKGDRNGALKNWQQCLQLDPNHQEVKKGLNALGIR